MFEKCNFSSWGLVLFVSRSSIGSENIRYFLSPSKPSSLILWKGGPLLLIFGVDSGVAEVNILAVSLSAIGRSVSSHWE